MNEKYDFYIVKNMHQMFLQVTEEGAQDIEKSLESMLLDIDMLVETVYRDRTFNHEDPDYYWHLMNGELVLSNGGIPRTDPFSYTAGDRPWVMHEWLFDVILFVLYDRFGVLAVQTLTIGLAFTSIYVAFLNARRVLNRPVLLIFLVLLCSGPVVLFATPRPHLFSYVFQFW